MNAYYRLINTLRSTFEEDSRVSTVVTGDTSDLDIYKKNIYPLVHINVLNRSFVGFETTALNRYNVEVTVVDIRDINKEIVNDKFWLNDNRHDNWNETDSILKTAENKLIKSSGDVVITEVGTSELLSFHKENALDGWQQSWTIDVADTYTKIC
jgi:hypothetical protein